MLLEVSPYLYGTIGSSSALALSVLGAAWFVFFLLPSHFFLSDMKGYSEQTKHPSHKRFTTHTRFNNTGAFT